MPELRWILLGLGVLFCIGLWWRESRRPRQAASSTARAGERTREEPLLAAQEPVWQPPPDLRIEVPEEEPAESLAVTEDAAPVAHQAAVVGAQERLARELFSPPVAEMLERIEPILGDTEIIVDETTVVNPDPPPTQRAQPERRPRVEEKIVTLRIAAPPLERFDGRALLEALRAGGFEHGKFSIFHKPTPDGATLCSAASLVEPGTFDLERMEAQRFPGVSLFAVLPGPMEAEATLDTMLGIARELAGRLRGVLQDERGAALSIQKVADIRTALSDWQRRAGAPAPGT
jgi:cell division protein ZipA